MVYALHRPDMFGSACPLSGLLGDARSRFVNSLPQNEKTSIVVNDPHNIISEASGERLEELRSVRWYVDCGDDDFLAESNVEIYLLMRERNIPLQFRMRDGGHTWEYWQESLKEVLRFISIGFAQQ